MPRAAATNRFKLRDFFSSLNFTATTNTIDTGATDWVGVGDITLIVWLNPTDNGGRQIINNGQFVVRTASSNRISCSNNNSTFVVSSTDTLRLNQWQCLLVTRTSAGTITIYSNDSQIGSGSGGTPVSASTNVYIGNLAAASSDLRGKMCNFQLFNRILTAQERSDLFLLGQNPSDYATSCVRDFKLNTGAGTVAVDSSANATNATITGATFSADVPMKARKLATNANLVKNGDFEYAPPFTAATTASNRWIDGTSGGAASNNLFGWAIPTAGITAGASARFDPTLSRSGSGSILLSTTDATGVISVTNAISGSSPSILTDAIYPLSPNTTYILTAYVQTVNAATNSVYCDFREFSYNGSTTGTTATTSTNKVSGTNSTWTLLTVTVTTASNTRFGQVLLRNLVAGNISSANFDDISITPVYPEGRVPANGNLVKNFNFEVAPTFVAATTTAGRWVDGSAAGSTTNATYKWGTNSTNSVGSISARFDPSTFATGVGSIKVSTTATGSDAVISNMLQSSATQVASFGIPVLPSTSYTYVFWMSTNYVSGDSNNGATVLIKERNAAATTLVTNTTSTVKVTSGWTRYTGTFTTGAATVFCEIQPSVLGNSGAATLIMNAWFDDIYLAPTTNPGRIPIT